MMRRLLVSIQMLVLLWTCTLLHDSVEDFAKSGTVVERTQGLIATISTAARASREVFFANTEEHFHDAAMAVRSSSFVEQFLLLAVAISVIGVIFRYRQAPHVPQIQRPPPVSWGKLPTRTFALTRALLI